AGPRQGGGVARPRVHAVGRAHGISARPRLARVRPRPSARRRARDHAGGEHGDVPARPRARAVPRRPARHGEGGASLGDGGGRRAAARGGDRGGGRARRPVQLRRPPLPCPPPRGRAGVGEARGAAAPSVPPPRQPSPTAVERGQTGGRVTTKTSGWLLLATAAALLCGAPTTALAQFDHLLCQKIKDPAPKATYTVGINE